MTHDRPASENAKAIPGKVDATFPSGIATKQVDKATGANTRIVVMCVAMLAAMGGLTAASVPLYRLFCQATGYDGTTQRAESGPVKVIDRLVTVRFDANVAPGLNWQFYPMQRDVTLKLGEVTTIRYFAKNLSKRTITGNATFNVTPESTGSYFNKLECFCFTETTLAPGERPGDAGGLLRRSGNGRQRGNFVGAHDHAVLHLLCRRRRTAGWPPPRQSGRAAAEQFAAAIAGHEGSKGRLKWRKPTRPTTTTTSSIPSPWPVIGATARLLMAVGGVAYMRWLEGDRFEIAGINIANPFLLFIGVIIVLYTMFSWWTDTVKEAHTGYHTRVVSMHLRYGMILFIASEVMFFVAWFWAFFDASLFPGEAAQVARSEFTGGHWPPQGIEVLDPFHLPLFNTIILLLSGTTVTWAHHSLSTTSAAC